MKRFYVAAAIAASLLATGCQKTYVIDEVRTPIGFSTEVGKQTKVIVDNNEYLTSQPFGVFAYGKQVVNGTSTSTTVMDNIKIIHDTDSKWRAEGTTKYYWPNDPTTTLSFYAYSPYSTSGSEGMGVDPSYDTTNGISFTGYTHTKYQGEYAVDFMTADAKDQTYTTNTTTNGTVDLKFAHKMTQIKFCVKKASTLPDATEETGVVLKLQSIKLLGINNKASYAAKSGSETDKWTIADPSITNDYTIYTNSGAEIKSAGDGIKPDAVTMIPQELTDTKKIEIVYTISGKGVASEEVTREIPLKGIITDNAWGVNQRITYNITINMKEILFNPTVENWEDKSGNKEIYQ